MFELLFFPFHLIASLFGCLYSLVANVVRGAFRFTGSLVSAVFSMPFLLIVGAISLILGLIRSLWPLICAGALGMVCYLLYQAGMQHAKDHPNDRFAQFIHRVRR